MKFELGDYAIWDIVENKKFPINGKLYDHINYIHTRLDPFMFLRQNAQLRNENWYSKSIKL